ncbi:uncharacterized protein LOC126830702 [Patella vulgata]|uniref:uncharacterized protein LOC126830702 n=1 Tax=Patella vulgata TaxID=6465 RepID=UPI0024A8D82F|nr:uncharacterized protein LOC126830702 [Patella vulgata]
MADSGCLCRNCQLIFDKMKRCVRCKSVYYCSRECQVKDWVNHKDKCLEYMNSVEQIEDEDMDSRTNESAIVDSKISNENNVTDKTPDSRHTSRINFEKAAKDLKLKSQSKNIFEEEKIDEAVLTNISTKFYYHNNEAFYDVPAFHSDHPSFQITVKFFKQRHKIDINDNWTSDEILKYLSCELEIPLEKIKIIHKGKLLTREIIRENIGPKSVLQLIGEKAANEQGLDKRDIDVMMKQLGVERNAAVNTLRQKGDLIDAIIEAANKS